ncbi:MAG: DNA translocase FtsK [Eubacterium sp.]|nr:DNA translocase FtsK [Eubacterium sp.]
MANNSSNQNNNRRQSQSRAAERERLERARLERERREANVNRIVGLVLFSLSVVFFFIAVVKGEGAWNFVHNVYLGIFGIVAACGLPLLTIVITILHSIRVSELSKFIAKGIESIIMLLLISAFIHIVQNENGADFGDTVVYAFQSASAEFNGGYIGAALGWLLLTLGKAPAIIVDLVLIFVAFMLLTGMTIIQFFKKVSKPAEVTYKKVAPAINERIEQKRLAKANIDVPLDITPPGEKPKTKRTRKAEIQADIPEEEPQISVPRSIIDEINAANERNRKAREVSQNDAPANEQVAPEKAKSLDDIVKDASEKKEEKLAKPEEFKVTDEQMKSAVEDYVLPSVNILKVGKQSAVKDISGELKINAERLIETLRSFNVDATITDISRGPTVTRYELKPAAGIRISKITNLSDDIALNLAATHVRIEAPIPGKPAVGIEVPNKVKSGVSMRELIDTPEFVEQKSKISAGLGKDIAGKCVYCDISKMPHLLIAGTTGSGKSVCMNSIIVSILYRARPDEVKFLMIDPKQVEFSKYIGIPHLLVPVVTDPRKAAGALGWAVSEMLQRYNKFSETGVRDIEGYNKYVAKHEDLEPMPKICIFIDELADLMMAAPKEVEDSICRLAQMARAAGMHLVIATQRPSVDVITGLIKANISSRIALTVTSQIDSRTILDTGGAEKLLGYGDMLYNPIGANKPIRVQGCYVSDEEVEELCDFIKKQGSSEYDETIQKEIEAKAVVDKKSGGLDDMGGEESSYDPLFEKAAEVVIETGTASTSFLQRKLSVGYARGAKIIDQLEEYGVIGKPEGSKPRQVLMTKQMWLEKRAYDSNTDFTTDNTVQMTFNDDFSDDDAEVIDNQGDGDFFD